MQAIAWRFAGDNNTDKWSEDATDDMRGASRKMSVGEVGPPQLWLPLKYGVKMVAASLAPRGSGGGVVVGR